VNLCADAGSPPAAEPLATITVAAATAATITIALSTTRVLAFKFMTGLRRQRGLVTPRLPIG
jgi:hypothetical protein